MGWTWLETHGKPTMMVNHLIIIFPIRIFYFGAISSFLDGPRADLENRVKPRGHAWLMHHVFAIFLGGFPTESKANRFFFRVLKIAYDVIDWIRTPLPCVATGATGPCRQREAKEVKKFTSPGTQRIGIEVNGFTTFYTKFVLVQKWGVRKKNRHSIFLSQV